MPGIRWACTQPGSPRLRRFPRQGFGQEVGGSHPIFERSKRMLNSAANLHLPRVMFQPSLHRIDYGFMFPALYPAFLTRRTLLVHCTGLAAREVVTMQQHAVFHRRMPPGQ